MLSLDMIGVVAFISCLLYTLSRAIYNAYLHPLRRFPGPKLWATTFLFRHVSAMRGELDWSIKGFHEKYGNVVRFSPDELSFIGEQAWKDIYGSHDPPLGKDPAWYSVVKSSDQAASIFNADHANHQRIRKQISHAFSEKAMREQEGAIQGYIDLLIMKLQGFAAAATAVDMVQWYNFTTFDLIGDLALGKSFDCLKDSAYHGWVRRIFQSIKIGPFVRTMATYTDIQRLMRLLAPAAVKEARAKHEGYVAASAQERIDKGIMEERKDFISYILRNRDAKHPVSDREIAANCNFLILAGSETTATALSGLTYHLLMNPETLKQCTDEIRSAFRSEAEINFVHATMRLPYTQASINEALRLYPPGPSIFPRRTPPKGFTTIAGYSIPPWTNVGVHALSSTHSPTNFYLPESFIPKRWLLSSTTDRGSPFFSDCRGASQPFSIGSRNCLGQSLAYNEMRVLIARVLWNFDLELCNESVDWGRQATYTLWEKGKLMCRLKSAVRI